MASPSGKSIFGPPPFLDLGSQVCDGARIVETMVSLLPLFSQRGLDGLPAPPIFWIHAAGLDSGLADRIRDLQEKDAIAAGQKTALQKQGDVQDDRMAFSEPFLQLSEQKGADSGVHGLLETASEARIGENRIGDGGFPGALWSQDPRPEEIAENGTHLLIGQDLRCFSIGIQDQEALFCQEGGKR